MRNAQFDVPVVITTSGGGQTRVVRNTVQAAEVLSGSWPNYGPKYQNAVKMMLAAMEGRKRAAAVRKAFVDAAKEAKVFVREGSDTRH